MTLRYVVCASLLLVAAPAFAAAPSAKKDEKAKAPVAEKLDRAAEAVHLFKTVCVDTKGDALKAEDKINAFVKAGVGAKLPDDKAEEFTGDEAKAAWVLQSPETKQRLMIAQRDNGDCSLYVNEAPQAKIREDFKALVAWVGGTTKGAIAGTTKKEEAEDHSFINDFYEVIEGKEKDRIGLAIASSAKPYNDTQHILTYSHIEAD